MTGEASASREDTQVDNLCYGDTQVENLRYVKTCATGDSEGLPVPGSRRC